VATVAVSDYQPVKAGDLLVQLRDDDFRAQVRQAEAAVLSSKDALVNNQRQKELQDARIVQADEGIRAAEADIAAAQESRQRNRRSPMHMPPSTQPKRMWSAQDWSGVGRRLYLRPSLRRGKSWSR
jgi:multidrug resistance efflux pump